MSGRKQSEVLDLLSTGKQIREKVLQNNYTSFTKNIKENSIILDKIEKEKQKFDFASFTLSKEIEEKYKNEVNLMKNEIKEIEEFVTQISLNDTKSYEKEFEELKKEFINCDKESEKLRNLVNGKSHYCDSEYKQAETLVSVYKNKVDRVVKLDRDISLKVGLNKEKIVEIEQKYKRKQEIEEKYNQLKQRAAADNNREQIKEDLDNLNKNDAKKFANDEYENLLSDINKILTEDNEVINRKSTEIFIKIAELKQKISNERSNYEMKKSKAIISLEDLITKNNSYQVMDIEALLDDKEIILSLFDFEKKYGLESFEKEYISGIEEINNLIAKENFDEAKILSDHILIKLNNKIDKARQQYERLLKEQDIATKIINALNNLGYDQIDIDYLDGDITKGYKLSAIVGDEELEFERIAIDENGTQILDINHKESVSGQCGHSMKKVMSAMQGEGIFITDIKKNGVSMVYSKAEQNNNLQKNELKREVR